MGRGPALAAALVLLVACEGGEEAEPRATPSAPSTTTTTRPCGPDGRSMTLRGTRVRQFCGPALAEVTVGEELLVFPGGACARHDDWFGLNIGFEVVDAEPGDAAVDPEFRAFTLLLGRHPLASADAPPNTGDGASTDAAITFAVPGRSYLIEDETVTLAGTRMMGVFTGTAFLGDVPESPLPVRGVFTCDSMAIPLEGVPAAVETLGRG